MKLFKRVAALAISGALALTSLTGCQQSAAGSDFVVPESVDLAAVTDPYLTTSGLSADTVVATVGDSDITAQQVLYWIAYSADSLMQYYGMYGMTELPWDTEGSSGTLAETMKQDALETAALYTLLPQMGEADGLELSEEFTASFDESLVQMAEALGGEELLKHYLWQFPLTKEMYTSLCQSEEFNNQILNTRFGEGAEGHPTDEDVLTFLEEDQQCYFFKHILLKVDETTTAEDTAVSGSDASSSADASTAADNSAEQKAKAEELLAQLKASDDPLALFDELMNEFSEDPGLATNPEGYLGSAKQNATVGTKMVDVVEQAVLGLKDGEYSGVLENTQGYHGYHIVLRLPLAEHVTVDDHREACIQARMSALQDSWLEENPIKTNKEFDKLDPAKFYQAMTVLRKAVSDESEALKNADSSESTSGSGSTSAPDASGSQK